MVTARRCLTVSAEISPDIFCFVRKARFEYRCFDVDSPCKPASQAAPINDAL